MAEEQAMSSTIEVPIEEEVPVTIRGPLLMSYDAWLDYEHEGGLTEWVDGEVIQHMPTKDEHQRVVDFLNRLLGLFVELFHLGLVRSAPFAMRIQPDGPGREPDLFFLANEHMQQLSRRQLSGPADLAIEIVSDGSVVRDRDEKYAEYEAGGVREYWIIDPRPNRLRADFFVRDSHGRYRPVPIGDDGIYHSTVLPGLWIRIEWLWEAEPNPLAALGAIVGIERIIAAAQGAAPL
jgi:Uma2 family endonuclease